MAKTMLQNRLASNQAYFSKDGSMINTYVITTRAFDKLIDEVIREYGKWDSVTYSLSAYKLDPNILAVFLPHILESDELDDLEQNPSLKNAYVKEHIEYIQKCIDSRCFEVFKEDMEEMGHCLRHHSDNGEPYFSRY